MILSDSHEGLVQQWLKEHHGVEALQWPRLVLGIFDQGVIVGAFVITLRCDTTAELHVFGQFSHETARAMFQRVFGSGIWRLEVRTERSNKAVKKAAPKYGFRFEGVARDYYGPGRDAFCYAMTADECRWLKGEVGRGVDGLTVQVA